MHDVIIIGGGPAGFSAAIYSARFKLKTLVLTKVPGGTMAEAHIIENYPGIQSISGMQLADQMQKQAEDLGVEFILDDVKLVERRGDLFLVNDKHESKYIVLCLGTERKKLNLPREQEFTGKGVSYCATCDAPLFRDKVVGVVGGSDSAIMAADLLARYAKKVYIIYRKEKFPAQPVNVDKALASKNVEAVYKTNVTELKGSGMLKSVMLDTGKELALDGLFIEIGSTPSTALAIELGLELDEHGCIVVDSEQETNVHAVYAAGDVTGTHNRWRQVIVAAAEGAIAAHSIYHDKPGKHGSV
ncbi:MAG: FAD-dependent oxidoreductase [Candidatus Woesearchaeota archaeon]